MDFNTFWCVRWEKKIQGEFAQLIASVWLWNWVIHEINSEGMQGDMRLVRAAGKQCPCPVLVPGAGYWQRREWTISSVTVSMSQEIPVPQSSSIETNSPDNAWALQFHRKTSKHLHSQIKKKMQCFLF